MKSPSCKSTRAKSLVNYSRGPLSCQMWGVGEFRNGYFNNHEQWGEPSQELRTASLLRWHARKIGSQPEKDTNEEQRIMIGVANVEDSDRRRLTCSSGF
uniref:Uncharacterized protein n=1 Tax=Mesocestoides corti TaxID=53468 RepID=A0A5K3F8Z7_MESCO